MKRLFVSLSVLYSVLAFGTATADEGTSILRNIPPAWSKALRCDKHACPRFELVLGGAAVLDHETGLVWERSPSLGLLGWHNAMHFCNLLNVGNRLGWHLPTIEQLASLIDTSSPNYPSGDGGGLPVGHPFTGVPAFAAFWSATTSAFGTDQAMSIGFGSPQSAVKTGGAFNVWCVRGGQSHDGK